MPSLITATPPPPPNRYLGNLCGCFLCHHLWGYYWHLLVGGHNVSHTMKNFPHSARTSGVLPDITYVVKTSEPGTELHYI